MPPGQEIVGRMRDHINKRSHRHLFGLNEAISDDRDGAKRNRA
jgi:hypothetical protein